MRRRSTINATLAALFLAVLANPAAAEVYRCVEGDTTVFSDIPCSDDAQPHRIRSGISVVAAAGDLDAVAERNREFVDQRRDKLAARRARSAQISHQAEIRRRTRAAAEDIRYRTIIGPTADSIVRGRDRPAPDLRTRAMQQQGDPAEDTPRRTLLSRSGGNQTKILR